MAFNISNKIKRIVEFDVQKHTKEIVEANAEYLAELLRTQLEIGQDGNGKDVTIRGNHDYQPVTVWNKRQVGVGLGAVTEWITTFMTGAFYKEIRPLTDGKVLTMKSFVPYFDAVIDQSGGIIMKINDANMKKFKTEILIPQLEKRMKNGL